MTPISNPSAASTRTVKTGSYTGDGNATQQIVTGFKCSMVVIHKQLHDVGWAIMPNLCLNHSGAGVTYHDINDPTLHASDGFVATNTAGIGGYSTNINANTYYYWAISE